MKTILTIEGDKTLIEKQGDDSNIGKVIATSDLIELFQSKNKVIDTPFLPIGTMKYVTNQNKRYVLFVQEAKEVTIRYNLKTVWSQIDNLGVDADLALNHLLDDQVGAFKTIEEERYIEEYDEDVTSEILEIETIRPKTAWFVQLHANGNEIHDETEKVFALKDSIITEDTPLCLYPFANTYDDHRVCWGNPRPAITNMMHISALSSISTSQVSNLDLTIKNVKEQDDLHFDVNGDPLFLHMTLHIQKKKGVSFEDRLEYLHQHMLILQEKTLLRSFKTYTEGQSRI